ncbi:MAG: RNA polymerase sigma factor [Armatimonadetes bacterium]|nr:RNA polymerase sigma factor [Armatimonadota bacterium]
MADDDPGLLKAFRRGDHAAFETVYRRYAARVMAFAFRLCGERSRAEDLVQETFVAAYKGRETFSGRSELLPWLLGIAWRRNRDAVRGRSFAEIPLQERDALVSSERGVAAQALDAVMLSGAIDRLPPVLSEAFHLVMVQGLTHREAAEVLGRPVGTVKWCTANAVKRLREALRDEPIADRESLPIACAEPVPGG